MLIVLVCAVILLLGIAAGVAWSGRSFKTPDTTVELTPVETIRRYVWYVAIAITAGVAAGITIIGAGGRLAMRLLAVTAGDAAQGKVTEADEIVGKITADGTIGFVLFNGIFGGLMVGTLYLLVRRYLPKGYLGGLTFGLGLLIVFSTIIDPLRSDNKDFDIVGPGWVAVLVFSAMSAVCGLTVAGFAARISEWLPLISKDRRVLAKYIAPFAVAALAFYVTAFLAVLCGIVVLLTQWDPLVNFVRSDRFIKGARVVLLSVILISLPHALTSIADIAGR